MSPRERRMNYRVVFHDDGPDREGKRRFTLLWEDFDGDYRDAPHPDGRPCGYRRGQCFHADPVRAPAHARVLREGADEQWTQASVTKRR